MCRNCGKCIETCPVQALSMKHAQVVWNMDICIDCDACIKTCEYLASPKIMYMSVEELVDRIKKERFFIRGITVSGGECMRQASFLKSLFIEVKKMGLSCLIDTNGYYDFEEYRELLALCDGVMLDVKGVDEAFHKQITGCDNRVVLKNLAFLLAQGKLEEVRTVILPNREEENLKTLEYVSTRIQNKSRYKLIKYRKFGVRQEGIEAFGDTTISDMEMQKYKSICEGNGNHSCVII